MTVEYIAWQLLTKYSTDAAVKAVLDKFDFYIMPIVNPDGKLIVYVIRKVPRSDTSRLCV